MALPVTISGLVHATGSITVSRPFISSGGNVYVIGRESTTLGAYKATDPTSSFSAVGTSPSLTNINNLNAVQVGDVLHVVTASASASTSVDYKYHTFNMATDAGLEPRANASVESLKAMLLDAAKKKEAA